MGAVNFIRRLKIGTPTHFSFTHPPAHSSERYCRCGFSTGSNKILRKYKSTYVEIHFKILKVPTSNHFPYIALIYVPKWQISKAIIYSVPFSCVFYTILPLQEESTITPPRYRHLSRDRVSLFFRIDIANTAISETF